MRDGNKCGAQPPDGYTFGIISQPFSMQFTLHPKLVFGLKDFAPIAMIAEYPSLLLASPRLPANTLKEFVAYAKTRSPAVTYAASGEGGARHLSMEMFRQLAGFNAVHIPYAGSTGGLLASFARGASCKAQPIESLSSRSQ